MEVLTFFNKLSGKLDQNGVPLFLPNDTMVMDNCGFHHRKFTEPELRRTLTMDGVNLIFQPPYCLHFNTCEFVFHHIKNYLRQNAETALKFTVMAIADAVYEVSPQESYNIFQHCNYL